jgi:hypothetical protein
MGHDDQFGTVLRAAIDAADWCSSDPICSETMQAGERTQSLSGCHACLFIPETSCEFFNCLLDRQALVGDLAGDGGLLAGWTK